MQAILRRGASLLSGSSSKDDKGGGFTTVTSPDELFPTVDPAVDGEDCDRDCATCTVHYPAKFDVDRTDALYGRVDGWATHLLVATGKADWARDVADEKGSLMEAIVKGGIVPRNGKLKLSASNIPIPDEYHQRAPGAQQPTTVLLLPAFIFVDHVTPALASDLIEHFVNPAITTTTPLHNPNTSSPSSLSAEGNEPEPKQKKKLDIDTTPLRARPCPHAAVILLCSQRTRDARCGISAPLLKREFERHLRPLGLYRDLDDHRPGGVGIYFVSHVGGHKYAANVIVYRRRDFNWYEKKSAGAAASGTEGKDGDEGEEGEGADEGAAQGIWIARVRPEDCEGIVKFTVLQGKVVKPGYQLRGGFDRERGFVSW